MNAPQIAEKNESHKSMSSSVQEILFCNLDSIIPLDRSGDPPTGKAYEFRDNTMLSDFLLDFGHHQVTLLELQAGEILPVHKVPEKCLLVIMNGSGFLVGDCEQKLKEGSILTIDKDTSYGIITEESAIHCLCLRFENYHYSQILKGTTSDALNQDLTYQSILDLNNKRLDECKKSSYFTMLQDGTLDDPIKRKRYLQCVKKVSDYFQKILYTRQATCSDEKYASIFLQHFKEEFEHNEVLFKFDEAKSSIKDAEFDAILTWFCYKMIDLDNIGKAIVVNLVFESAGDYMCNFVKDKDIYHACPDYFHVHAEVDEGHTDMATELLYHQHSEVYRKAFDITNEAWDMFMAMFNRMVYIVNRAGE